MSQSITCDNCKTSTTDRDEIETRWLKFTGPASSSVDACSYVCLRTLVDQDEAAVAELDHELAAEAAAAASDQTIDAGENHDS